LRKGSGKKKRDLRSGDTVWGGDSEWYEVVSSTDPLAEEGEGGGAKTLKQFVS